MCWFSQGFFTPSINVPLIPNRDLTEPYPTRLLKAIGRPETLEQEVVVLASDEETANRVNSAVKKRDDVIIGKSTGGNMFFLTWLRI